MALSAPVTLSDTEKLDALRQLDQFRHWRSLDDKRYCLVCGNIITGREIQIWSGSRDIGRLRVSCPTGGCNSIPMDWVLPTNEILAKIERAATDQIHNAPAPVSAPAVVHTSTAPEKKPYATLASRWRKLGLRFKHSL